MNYFIFAAYLKIKTMEAENLSPEKSFELITDVINQARSRFEENGFIYMFWGVLLTVTSLTQFALLKSEHYDINWYPYFLMPLGAIYTSYYYAKRKKKVRQNQIGIILAYAWFTISLNLMILGFVFSPMLRENSMPVILIVMSLGILISGVAIKSKMLLFSGIFVNIAAFVCFEINWIYHPLILAIISVIAMFIPGLVLMKKHKKVLKNA